MFVFKAICYKCEDVQDRLKDVAPDEGEIEVFV